MTEWLTVLASNPAFNGLANLAQIAGGISILVGVIRYFREADDRRKAKHYQAWQVVNSAAGQSSSGGRVDALQDLVRDDVTLAGIDLSKAWLARAQLPFADLRYAALNGTNLEEANLRRARLNDARGAKLSLHNTRLDGASLTDAHFPDVDLRGASLVGAYLHEANLQGGNLLGANVSGARFYRTDLRHVRLASLRGWQSIDTVTAANIFGVTDAPDGFVSWALSKGAVEVATDAEWDTAKQASAKAEWLPGFK